MRRKRFRTTRRLSRRPEASSSAEASTEARSRWSNEPEASRWSTSRDSAARARSDASSSRSFESARAAASARSASSSVAAESDVVSVGVGASDAGPEAREDSPRATTARRPTPTRARIHGAETRARAATPRVGAVARPSGRRTEVDDEPSEPLRIAKNEEYPIGPAGRSARGATHRRLKSPRRRFGRVTPIEAPRPTASLANIGSVVRSGGARGALCLFLLR